jgi:DMSO/TMAO reductase YedYZ molybdopterin-dependent catalytic subunit
MTINNDKSTLESPERRDVLRQGAALGALGLAGSWWSQFALAADETLVPFSDMPDPYIAPPVAPGGTHYLDSRGIDTRYTPNNDFYIVQHYNQPTVDASGYKLRVTGLVNKPLELDLAAIKRRPRVELEAGFECGGNSPRLFQGLIGNARWVGTPLKGLLEEAGVKPDGIEVVCYGHDKGEETIRDIKVEQNFGRSLHISDALNPDVMLAWEMNGEPLPLYHGAPLRLLVPGWYGVANVKWLSQIHVQDRRFMGRFMGRDYVTLSKQNIGGEVRWEERSVTKIRLKSSIVRVTKRGQSHLITGFVLNDGTPLKSVEVNIDGAGWQNATIDAGASRYGWKLFRYEWKNATAGEHTLVSRVTDSNGQVQATPEEMPEKPTRWENYAQFPRKIKIG